MKVYATFYSEIEQNLILLEWASIKEFESEQSWIDSKWIDIRTTETLKLNDSEAYSKGLIVHTPIQILSCNLMHKKYLEVTQ